MDNHRDPLEFPANFVFSQSSLQDYMDCPRRFSLRYLKQLDYPAEEMEPALENERRLQEGEYFHRLVQQSLLGLPAEKLARLANTPDLARWWQNWEAFRHTAGFERAQIFPEWTLSAPLGEFRLLAKYDLIVLSEDKIWIYDWKTYHRRPRNEWLAARWQTRLYPALLCLAGHHLNDGQPIQPEQIEMIYWFTNFPAEPASFPYRSAQFQRDQNALRKLIAEIANTSEFPPTEDTQRCRFCSYRGYCDRGAEAGDLNEAEVDMEAEEWFDVNFEQVGEIAF
jgi:RecB family exonuclease